MDELDALLDALLDAEAAHRLGDGPAARPASAGDIEVPDAPMPLVGAALPDGRTLWFCNRREPVGLARVTPGFIVQHDGRYWRVEETVTYLRLSPYPGTGEEAAEESRETSLPGPAALGNWGGFCFGLARRDSGNFPELPPACLMPELYRSLRPGPR